MKKVWDYGTSTPVQRAGIIVLSLGLISLLAWVIKEDLSFEDIFDSYHFPRYRDSFFFHLYFYLIPLGFLMSWGYRLLIKLKQWVFYKDTGKSVINSNEPILNKHLHFKDNTSAFEFASSISVADLSPQKINLGTVFEIMKSPHEKPFFIINLANIKNKVVVGGFNDKYANSIHVGDLVYWAFVELVEYEIYPEIQAVGYIIATVQPEFDPKSQKWILKKDLTQ